MRVLWFCEEIGLDYRLETVEMFSDAMKRPEYLAIHPLGKVPAIEDDGSQRCGWRERAVW